MNLKRVKKINMSTCPPGYPYQQPPQYSTQRYIRSLPTPSEPAGPPYQDRYPGYGPPERPYPAPHSTPPYSYLPHYDTRGRHGPYPGPQPYPSQRDDMVRMSPAPLDVPPNHLYHQEQVTRERYPPEGYYPTGAQPQSMRSNVRVSLVSPQSVIFLCVYVCGQQPRYVDFWFRPTVKPYSTCLKS